MAGDPHVHNPYSACWCKVEHWHDDMRQADRLGYERGLAEADAWWATRFASAHSSGGVGRQSFRELTAKTNEVLGDE